MGGGRSETKLDVMATSGWDKTFWGVYVNGRPLKDDIKPKDRSKNVRVIA